MGDMWDCYIDFEDIGFPAGASAPRPVRKNEWRTREGDLIRIEDMTDEHLAHSVRLLLKREPLSDALRAKYDQLTAEAFRRGIDVDAVAERDIEAMNRWMKETGGEMMDWFKLSDAEKGRRRSELTHQELGTLIHRQLEEYWTRTKES